MNVFEAKAWELRLVGGRLCLDFVNTVGGRKLSKSRGRGVTQMDEVLFEKLIEYGDLLAWCEHAGAIRRLKARSLRRRAALSGREAAGVLERALAFRESMFRALVALLERRAPAAVDLRVINAEIATARASERLVYSESGLRWRWSEEGDALASVLWPIAKSAAEFMASEEVARLRLCGGEECGWLFEDTSRNRGRQWCRMEDCGNLAKIRRFRTRLRTARAMPS